MRVLAREVRLRHNRKADPTMVMIDGQTVKGGRAGPTFHEAGGRGGYTRGAKRTILIEILGLPLAVSVESAKPHDVQSARRILKEQLDPKHPALPGLQAIVADRGYTGLVALATSHGLNLDIKVPPAPPMLPPTKPGGKSRKGKRVFTPLAPALQGRERLRPARHVAAAVALLRADGARRADLARGRLRRLPLRAAPGRADLMAASAHARYTASVPTPTRGVVPCAGSPTSPAHRGGGGRRTPRRATTGTPPRDSRPASAT